MNGSVETVQELADAVVNGTAEFNCVDIVLCPSDIYLGLVSRITAASDSVSVGAQNASEHTRGAYTGDVSSEMLIELGCEYAIVGHSERRQYHAESDEKVAAKTRAVIASGLAPITCVGETLEQRQSGETKAVIERQLDAVVRGVGNKHLDKILIAYEPVWAIGTGQVASALQAQEVHNWIRQFLGRTNEKAATAARILYGGSVKGDNAHGVLSQPDVDGCLVGGASLDAAEFIRICRAAG